ncbi:class I SAM-dependent methyltransferase [Streptomyces sp. NPDC002265]|uniref:class I SAM-dependent DNA methyltransferase n=1 Tax=Streptomyces sp. NPDC002265 TaxID=3154415 RepID=UPI00332B7BE1
MVKGTYATDYGLIRIDRTGQAEAFDAIGRRYDEAFRQKDGRLSAGAWLIASLPPGSRVLDLGCGTGLPTTRRPADAGLEVVGVDLSPGMLRLARKSVPGATFHRLGLADLRPAGPHDLGRFAVAAFFSLLLLSRAEIPLALRTVRHLLVPGGLFALSMVEADVDAFAIPFLGNTIRVSGYLREELYEVIEAGGFEILGESSYTYAPAVADVPPEEQVFLCCRRRD